MDLSKVETYVLLQELANRKEVQVYNVGKYQNHRLFIESKFDKKREMVELPKHGQVLIGFLPN